MNWDEEAACRSIDPDVFFPRDDVQGRGYDVRAAKRVCVGCPVRAQCLEFALAGPPRVRRMGRSHRDRTAFAPPVATAEGSATGNSGSWSGGRSLREPGHWPECGRGSRPVRPRDVTQLGVCSI